MSSVRDFLGEDVPESYLEAIIDEADILRDKRCVSSVRVDAV
jgi:hypothetical protein